jgi:hypothetical protein
VLDDKRKDREGKPFANVVGWKKLLGVFRRGIAPEKQRGAAGARS